MKPATRDNMQRQRANQRRVKRPRTNKVKARKASITANVMTADLQEQLGRALRERDEAFGAADGDVRSAESHLKFARQAGAGVRNDAGECGARVRRKLRHHGSV